MPLVQAVNLDFMLLRELEKEEEADKEKEKKRVKRLQRKNRDGMTALLDELHEQVCKVARTSNSEA